MPVTCSPTDLLHRVYLPWVPLPPGEMTTLPGRGDTFITDTPGPTPDAPPVVLLHALGTTGLLTWFPAIGRLAERFRVLTLDQRWHGRGIMSAQFSLRDCADDVAALIAERGLEHPIVAGYSMGSIVAQRVWRQHPDEIGGLVLCATTDRFRQTAAEKAFHALTAATMHTARGVSRSRTATTAARAAARALEPQAGEHLHEWALAEFRSTSPWAVAQAVAALGRHHSRPWLRRIDVPAAVVVNREDGVIPPERQLDVAARIPGATIHEINAGHGACVFAAERFVPALEEALVTVNARRNDTAWW